MAILNQGYGYGIVIGFGIFFSLLMSLVSYAVKKFGNEAETSEQFATAGRTIKTGLIASSVVSAWTWAATLLQSSSVAYDYGVSGPYWYAAVRKSIVNLTTQQSLIVFSLSGSNNSNFALRDPCD